jgi:hypothetical protein
MSCGKEFEAGTQPAFSFTAVLEKKAHTCTIDTCQTEPLCSVSPDLYFLAQVGAKL